MKNSNTTSNNASIKNSLFPELYLQEEEQILSVSKTKLDNFFELLRNKFAIYIQLGEFRKMYEQPIYINMIQKGLFVNKKYENKKYEGNLLFTAEPYNLTNPNTFLILSFLKTINISLNRTTEDIFYLYTLLTDPNYLNSSIRDMFFDILDNT